MKNKEKKENPLEVYKQHLKENRGRNNGQYNYIVMPASLKEVLKKLFKPIG